MSAVSIIEFELLFIHEFDSALANIVCVRNCIWYIKYCNMLELLNIILYVVFIIPNAKQVYLCSYSRREIIYQHARWVYEGPVISYVTIYINDFHV